MTDREEFEKWLFKEHTLPEQSISYTAEEIMFELWKERKQLQAAQSARDAEVAELGLDTQTLANDCYKAEQQLAKAKGGAE